MVGHPATVNTMSRTLSWTLSCYVDLVKCRSKRTIYLSSNDNGHDSVTSLVKNHVGVEGGTYAAMGCSL